MKYLIFYSVFILVACRESKQADVLNNTSSSQFDWLLGNWVRSNNEEGKVTYENWEKRSDSLYNGLGFTIKGNDTISQEHMQILRQGAYWSFSARIDNDSVPTFFIITSKTDTSFKCENPQNEFPKIIKYQIKGDSLMAVISGGGPEIKFLFGKLDE